MNPATPLMLIVVAALTATTPVNASTGGSVAEQTVTGTNPGFLTAELNAIDSLAHAWMRETGTPGLSIAYTLHGRLVLARAYGYADVERNERVTPNHRFRIASLSKPITAIAIMKLIEQRKLQFDSRVFGSDALLGRVFGKQEYHQWTQHVTIDHLLTHTSGAWGSNYNDPMFLNAEWSVKTLIDYTLDRHPLTAAPGEQYDYSNFGYSVLGRVIEQRTGLSYESFVQQAVLRPAGARNMTIAGNTLDQRKPNEVRYYPAQAYQMNVPRMDAHGGWIATPSDLLRVLVRVDGFSTVEDQVSPELVKMMFTPSRASDGRYGRGWSVNSASNHWHAGSLPGTSAILVSAHDGLSWAALANSRPENEADRGKLDRLMWEIRGAVSQWPVRDLFDDGGSLAGGRR